MKMRPIKPITRRDFLKLTGGALLASSVTACQPEKTTPPLPHFYRTAEPITNPIPSNLEKVSLRLLWTGDLHGQIQPIYHREPFEQTMLDFYRIEPNSPEAYLCSSGNYLNLAQQFGKVGGLANVATVINAQRSEFPENALLLDSGDTWHGSGIASLTQGEAVVEAMNAIGYDAMTFHWEMDFGQTRFFELVGQFKGAMLAQNLVDTDFEDPILAPSLIKEIGGNRIGVIGQAYPFSLTSGEGAEPTTGLRLGYREDQLQAKINRLRDEESVQLIILLSHMGYLQDREIAKRLTGIDIIIGGHTHDILWQPEQIGHTLVLQAGSHGKFLGQIDLELQNGKMIGYQHQLIPILADRIEPDIEVENTIQSFYTPYQDELDKIVGESQSVLYRDSIFGGTSDTVLGQAYRDTSGAEISFTPGVRSGASLLPGDIRMEDIYNVFKPTISPLYSSQLTCGEIRVLLENNFETVFTPNPLEKSGGYPLRCLGIEADVQINGVYPNRLSNVSINNQPINEKETYMVSTSGMRIHLMDSDYSSTQENTAELVANWIADHSPLKYDDPISSFHPKDQ